MTDALAVAVNLMWLAPGRVGGSEQYLVRQLAGLPTDSGFDVTLYCQPAFVDAHPQLAERFTVESAPLRRDRRGMRIVAEHTWLTRRTRSAAVVHHGGGTAHLADRLNLTVYASASTAKIVSSGDEAAVSLPPAKAAGAYPMDYAYRPCPVNRILSVGEVVEIGPLKIEPIATPGHSHDHHCYLVTAPQKRYLVGGDTIFFGGRVVWQNTYDCSVPETLDSIQRLAGLEFEALLPGHLNFSLRNGKRHVETACRIIDRLGCPPSI